MPKYTEQEKQFWEMMLKYANSGKQKLYCNICHRKIRSQTKQAHDHFFGITHKGYNVYEIFSPTTILEYELVPDPKTGVLLPKEIKK